MDKLSAYLSAYPSLGMSLVKLELDSLKGNIKVDKGMALVFLASLCQEFDVLFTGSGLRSCTLQIVSSLRVAGYCRSGFLKVL